MREKDDDKLKGTEQVSVAEEEASPCVAGNATTEERFSAQSDASRTRSENVGISEGGTSADERSECNSGGKHGVVRRTSVGGQAVLEGVMMKSATTVATAVRTETGAITVESRRLKPLSEKASFSDCLSCGEW